MKNVLIFILLFTISSTFSQEKKAYFFDVDLKTQLSEREFYLKRYLDKKLINLDLHFENDTSYVAILHPRKKYGKLSLPKLDSLKTYLNSISSKQKELSNHIIINFIEETKDNPCAASRNYTGIHIYHNDYKKKLDKILDFDSYAVFKDKESTKGHPKRKIFDKQLTIKKLFFNYYIPCGSFVVIKPDGRYICNYGEYGKEDVWGIAEEISKSDK